MTSATAFVATDLTLSIWSFRPLSVFLRILHPSTDLNATDCSWHPSPLHLLPINTLLYVAAAWREVAEVRMENLQVGAQYRAGLKRMPLRGVGVRGLHSSRAHSSTHCRNSKLLLLLFSAVLFCCLLLLLAVAASVLLLACLLYTSPSPRD